MDEDDLSLDFSGNLSYIVNELKSLGEVITNAEVAAKIVRYVSRKFDVVTTSIEQFKDLEMRTLEQGIVTLMVHEDKLKALLVKRAEKARLVHGRGCDQNNNRSNEDEEDEKLKDKSKVTSDNFQGKGHFANECQKPRKER